MARINTKTGKIIERQEFSGTNPEKQLQQYVEKFLYEHFQTYHLKSFYKIPGGEIDTLAITEDGNPVIIEYKHKKEETILNQIVFYYDWLHERSAKYEFERIAKENKQTKKINVDWSKIRLICIAKEYSKWDISLIKHIDTDIECNSYTYHKDELDIHLDPIINQNKKQKNTEHTKIHSTKELTLDIHRNKADEEWKKILDIVRDGILSLGDDVTEGYAPEYIKYYVKTTFADIHVRKKKLIIQLRINSKTFHDPKRLSKDISNRNWTTNREVKLENKAHIKYVIGLIKQAYKYQVS
ncbi:MAG: hypothetical protein EPN85_04865 [Bacteroidetes bacterium]|nr:MAG: hypothetical protein EPN85_04865 [Bacteroidota bacterium]